MAAAEAPSAPRRETVPVPERPGFQEGLVGLQARLLLSGDALNPSASLTAVNEQSLQRPFEERAAQREGTYGLSNRASVNERKAYWQQQEIQGFDAQKNAWIKSTVSTLNNGRFFDESEKGRAWKNTFARINIRAGEFGAAQAEQMYDGFLSPQVQQLGTQRFVQTVLESYRTEDRTIDYQRLHQDLSAWQWMANIFGDKSSQVIAQLSDAEAKLSNTQQRAQLIEQANTQTDNQTLRVNDLLDKEKELLIFLWRGEPGETQEGKTPEPQTREAETRIPNIDVGENLRATEQYIRILRDPDRYNSIPIDTQGRLRHELGFVIEPPPENGWFIVNDFLFSIEAQYRMPMAMYVAGNHARLVLNAPYHDTDGQWKIKAYDPMRPGEQEIVLPNYDVKVNDDTYLHLLSHGIYSNMFGVKAIEDGSYDISISGNEEVRPYIDVFMQGKLVLLQQDAKNCIPYAAFVGVMLNALKPGDTDFKRVGIPQFQQDFGIRIRTLEEIMETPKADEARTGGIRVSSRETTPADTTDITPENIAEVEAWIGPIASRDRDHVTRVAQKLRDERTAINEHYSGHLPDLTPIDEGSWEKQTNPGMFTCQFTAAGNILRTFGVFDPAKHTEKAFIDTLGGQEYVNAHREGAAFYDVEQAIRRFSPEMYPRLTNSVYEILLAVERGEGAIIPVGPGHVAAILPGNRVSQDASGNLQVQVVDSISGIYNIPIENLIKSNITRNMGDYYPGRVALVLRKENPVRIPRRS